MNVTPHKKSRLSSLVAVLAVIGAISVACKDTAPPPPALPKTLKTFKHLVMIVSDSFRPDLFTLQGLEYRPAEMTAKLADQSVVFENAYAQGTTPASSYMSLMTSTHVRTHGVDIADGEALPRAGICGRSDLTLLSEVLAENGFETTAAVATRQLSPKAGFPRGFRRWNRADVSKFATMKYRDDYTKLKPNDDKTIRYVGEAAFSAWTKSSARQFLYVHFAGPELPYAPSELARSILDIATVKTDYDAETIAAAVSKDDKKELEHIRRAYLAEIWEMDKHIYHLLFQLKENHLEDDTVVVVTGNRGVRFYAPTKTGVDDIYAKVPLIVHVPGEAPRTVRRPVGHIDVAPTMLRLLGIEKKPASWQGTDLFAETGHPVVTERLSTTAVRLSPEVRMGFDSSGTPGPLGGDAVPGDVERRRLEKAYKQWQETVPKGGADTSAAPTGMCRDGD